MLNCVWWHVVVVVVDRTVVFLTLNPFFCFFVVFLPVVVVVVVVEDDRFSMISITMIIKSLVNPELRIFLVPLPYLCFGWKWIDAQTTEHRVFKNPSIVFLLFFFLTVTTTWRQYVCAHTLRSLVTITVSSSNLHGGIEVWRWLFLFLGGVVDGEFVVFWLLAMSLFSPSLLI